MRHALMLKHAPPQKLLEKNGQEVNEKGIRRHKGDMEMIKWTDELTEKIIDSIICVHQVLGPGFLEIIYHRALLIEFDKRELQYETEKDVVIQYKGQPVGRHRLDLVVKGKVIVELKTVENLSKAHYAQIRSYLKATEIKVGILVNFAKEKADFRRIEVP